MVSLGSLGLKVVLPPAFWCEQKNVCIYIYTRYIHIYIYIYICTSEGPQKCCADCCARCSSWTVVMEVEFRQGVCNHSLAEWTSTENGWRSSV